MSLFSKRGCWMDLVVWNILLTWPWALLWLPICFWVQPLDLILILKGLRATLFEPWLNSRCPEIPSWWGVSIQFSWTQLISFDQYENSYILVDSGLRNSRTWLQLKLYVLDIICLPPYLSTVLYLALGSRWLTIIEFINRVLSSQTYKWVWPMEVLWVDIGKWCWSVLPGISLWACFRMGESFHSSFFLYPYTLLLLGLRYNIIIYGPCILHPHGLIRNKLFLNYPNWIVTVVFWWYSDR